MEQFCLRGLLKLVDMYESNFGIFPGRIKEYFLKNDVVALIARNSRALVDFNDALLNYKGFISFIVGEKDSILSLVHKKIDSNLLDHLDIK